MVGFFFTGSAIIGILVSQFLAGRSDRKRRSQKPDCFCCLLGVFACVLFAWNRNYFILLLLGCSWAASARPPAPQMFALAREHADRTGREAVMFSSILRAQVSLAWVIGPRSPTHWQWVWLYGNVPQRGGSLRGVWRNGMVLPAFHA